MTDFPPWPIAAFFGVALAYGTIKAVLAAIDRKHFRRAGGLARSLLHRPNITKSDRKLILHCVGEANDRRSALTAAIAMFCLSPLFLIEMVFCAFKEDYAADDAIEQMERSAMEDGGLRMASRVAGVDYAAVTIWDDEDFRELRDLAGRLEFTGSPLAYMSIVLTMIPALIVAELCGGTARALKTVMRRVPAGEQEAVSRAASLIGIIRTSH